MDGLDDLVDDRGVGELFGDVSDNENEGFQGKHKDWSWS
jgi:hypothetical protein